MQYWLLKSDPDTYGWPDLERDEQTRWDGIRNFQARNFLRQMEVGDLAFFYHSQAERAIVGVVEITRAAYPDPTASEGDWSCVEIRKKQAWDTPVSLDVLQTNAYLQNMVLLRQGRLSATPVSAAEWKEIERLRG